METVVEKEKTETMWSSVFEPLECVKYHLWLDWLLGSVRNERNRIVILKFPLPPLPLIWVDSSGTASEDGRRDGLVRTPVFSRLQNDRVWSCSQERM